MFVYSGNYKFCLCGLPTSLKDDRGIELRTGDIVIMYTTTKDLGIIDFTPTLSVVVANDFVNIQGSTPKEKKDIEKEDPFIMGIRSCNINEPATTYPNTVWRVRRVKEYGYVVAGENWHDYKFNFKEE